MVMPSCAVTRSAIWLGPRVRGRLSGDTTAPLSVTVSVALAKPFVGVRLRLVMALPTATV